MRRNSEVAVAVRIAALTPRHRRCYRGRPRAWWTVCAMLHLPHLALTERGHRTHAREHFALPRRGAARTVATTRAADPRQLAPGQRLDERYRITGFLGQGGMGAVY